MGLPLCKWWTVGEDNSVMVYRPGLVLPLALLTILTVLLWVTVSRSIRDYTFFLVFGSYALCPLHSVVVKPRFLRKTLSFSDPSSDNRLAFLWQESNVRILCPWVRVNTKFSPSESNS